MPASVRRIAKLQLQAHVNGHFGRLHKKLYLVGAVFTPDEPHALKDESAGAIDDLALLAERPPRKMSGAMKAILVFTEPTFALRLRRVRR